jgi:hypothetical protein
MTVFRCPMIVLVALIALAARGTEEIHPPDLGAPSNATEQWLDSVIIPEVDFRAANLPDCLAFVVERANDSAAQSQREPMRVLFELEAVRQYQKRTPCPTFGAQDISVLRALKIIATLAELHIESRPGQIIVTTQLKSANTSLHGSTQSRASAPSSAP